MKSSETVLTEERPPSNAVRWCLRWVILIQCVGLAGRYLISSGETESDIYGLLYFDLRWPEWISQSSDDTGMWLTLASAVVLGIAGLLQSRLIGSLIGNPLGESILRKWDQAALLWIAAWMVSLSIAHMMRASVYGEIALAEHAVRYGAPIALFVLLRRPALIESSSDSLDPPVSNSNDRVALAVLVIAATATFLAHGYKAWEHYAPFTDLILLTDLRLTGLGLSQSAAESSLVIIGVLDGIVAIALLAFRFRIAAAYMGVWGLVTAVSRMTALGFDAWPETVLRAANGGVPIAILIFLFTQLRHPQTHSE